jgi:hypothetical protein
MLASVLGGLIIGYLVWSLVALEINYRRASTMGIPLVRLPFDPINIAWQILESPLWRLLDCLPVKWRAFGRYRYTRRDWVFRDKGSSHVRYGPAWALVTPGDIYVHVSDPDAIHDIFVRRGDFQRPRQFYGR